MTFVTQSWNSGIKIGNCNIALLVRVSWELEVVPCTSSHPITYLTTWSCDQRSYKGYKKTWIKTSSRSSFYILYYQSIYDITLQSKCFVTRHAARWEAGGAAAPPDFGGSNSAAGSGCAPPFHRPPQIFRLCCIPGYCLRMRGRLKCICGKFELHDLLRRLCQFLFSLLYGQNGGRGPAPPPVPPSWVI